MHWPLWRVAVAEQSMEPALAPGDWLLAWRGLRPGAPPRVRPGQVVIARHPGRADFLLVKRAVRREAGGWWLESDNRAVRAVDSRTFGPVPAGLIQGRMLVRYRRARPASAGRGSSSPGSSSPGSTGPGHD
jgi:nickel-type superoxide dismutase maturation protease